MAAALPRAAMEQWATNALGGLCAGWVLPLGASTVRELREGARPGALRVVWTHRVLEMCWNAALGLDAAATHGKLLTWAGGDGARVAAAHALGWTAAAVARAVGVSFFFLFPFSPFSLSTYPIFPLTPFSFFPSYTL